MQLTKRIFALMACLLLSLALITGCSVGISSEDTTSQYELTESGGQEDSGTRSASSDQIGDEGSVTTDPLETPKVIVEEGGSYTSKDDVAAYIYVYGKLPDNFITKKEARELGWSGGSLEPYAPGKCIGGDYFGNYEGILPENGSYHECDIDTLGKKSRGAKRIIYSDDGRIYYTEDHYESFTLLYGTE